MEKYNGLSKEPGNMKPSNATKLLCCRTHVQCTSKKTVGSRLTGLE